MEVISIINIILKTLWIIFTPCLIKPLIIPFLSSLRPFSYILRNFQSPIKTSLLFLCLGEPVVSKSLSHEWIRLYYRMLRSIIFTYRFNFRNSFLRSIFLNNFYIITLFRIPNISAISISKRTIIFSNIHAYFLSTSCRIFTPLTINVCVLICAIKITVIISPSLQSTSLCRIERLIISVFIFPFLLINFLRSITYLYCHYSTLIKSLVLNTAS